jgi:hypothetical protein
MAEIKTEADALEALKKEDPVSLEDIPEGLRTETVCNAAIQAYPRNLEYVPNEMKSRELCLLAIEESEYNPESVLYGGIPENIKTKDFLFEATKRNIHLLPFVHEELSDRLDELFSDSDFCLRNAAQVLEYMPKDKITSELCMAAISKDGRLLHDVPDEFKTFDMCLTALENRGGELSAEKKTFARFKGVYDSIPESIRNSMEFATKFLDYIKTKFSGQGREPIYIKLLPPELKKEIKKRK